MTTATTHDFQITKQFVTAGNAKFTISNPSGVHYTFRVLRKKMENRPDPVLFISLLTGPDNTASFTYLGVLNESDGTVRLTKKSRYNDNSLPVRVIRWAAALIWANGNPPAGYSFAGAGCCGRCGRELTHPDGIANGGFRLGFGPECWKIMNGGAK